MTFNDLSRIRELKSTYFFRSPEFVFEDIQEHLYVVNYRNIKGSYYRIPCQSLSKALRNALNYAVNSFELLHYELFSNHSPILRTYNRYKVNEYPIRSL